MKILVIDDEPFALKLITQQLSNLGYNKVTTMEYPHEALAILENSPDTFNMVLLDLQMPEIDGVEFVRHLFRIKYSGSLILISGEDERILHTTEKLATSHDLRILGSLHKPVTPEQLKSIIERAPDNYSRAMRKLYGPDELRQALLNDELVNHYQPQVDICSGKVVGVESLVRWLHPEDGVVYPDQFISTAEEHGLIDDLTRTVFSKALEQAYYWYKNGLALHVAVNVSMDNLVSLDFADHVVSEVKKVGLPITNIVLEVTESRLMKDSLVSLDILTRLRLKHIHLSIDDFGTGHSSLAQLRDIPFDELKIDQGFIHGAHDQSHLRAIVEASIGMAQHLGMKTVAEGVEDQMDWKFLQTTGCDYAQGYFIAKPMPADQIVPWIPSWESFWQEQIKDKS